MNTEAANWQSGLLKWKTNKRIPVKKPINIEKHHRILESFAMHTVAPDRYRGLLEREKLARNIGEKGLNAKKPAFQLAL